MSRAPTRLILLIPIIPFQIEFCRQRDIYPLQFAILEIDKALRSGAPLSFRIFKLQVWNYKLQIPLTPLLSIQQQLLPIESNTYEPRLQKSCGINNLHFAKNA